ncbi:hypothetical protein ACIBKY_53670 [Nonomuraea sp. NPDC050394]|uniref:hypothetical protein n=1 Tax=Nonomuraea sp. NPDC050394 TaxID=3364363 RepID=UPI00378C0F8B
MRGRHVYHVRIAFTGSPEEGERLVQPLRLIGPRLMETLADLPYSRSSSIHDDPPIAMPWAADSAMLTDLDGKAIHTLLSHVAPDAPLPAIIELRHLGGALAEPPAHVNAVGHRDAAYMLAVLTPLIGTDVAAAHRFLDLLFHDLEPWAAGRFVNFMGHGDNADHARVRTAYEPHDHERLAARSGGSRPARWVRRRRGSVASSHTRSG